MDDLEQFLDPIDIDKIKNDHDFTQRQMGNQIQYFYEEMPDLQDVDLVIIGANESRGAGHFNDEHPANVIREKFYKLYYWHKQVKIADLGNIKAGKTLNDTYFCLKTIMADVVNQKTKVVILGGSHDLTLAQSYIYQGQDKTVAATVIDAVIDLKTDSMNRSENFLIEMLTDVPNYVRQYNHIGFQSYFTDPQLLNEMNKLGFDCTRVGVCKERMDEVEPIIRSSELISFDINSIQYSDIPGSGISPNGFTGEEACKIAQYAGQSNVAETIGIYGYNPDKDIGGITATQIAQMMWYIIDGINFSYFETAPAKYENYNQYLTPISEHEIITFMQSKKTGRWWIKLDEESFVPCTYSDYLSACNKKIPERWLKAHERDFN